MDILTENSSIDDNVRANEATGDTDKQRIRWWNIMLPACILLIALLVPPWSLEAKARLVGYGVCHQMPEHSFQPGGYPLPLCARCTGTFIGGLLGFVAVWALGRQKAAMLPPVRVLVALVLFIMVMGVDGINSYLSLVPAWPHLYEPNNTLRVATGMLTGIALAALLQPVLSITLWREPEEKRAISGFRTLLGIVALGAAVVLLVRTEWALTLIPLTLLSAISVLFMFTLINAIVLVIAFRRENTVGSWREALPFLLWGTVATLVEIGTIDLIRAWLTYQLGAPF
jgi:uncharacterized membrane protein